MDKDEHEDRWHSASIAAYLLSEFLNQLRHQRLVTGRLRADADNVHVGVDRLRATN